MGPRVCVLTIIPITTVRLCLIQTAITLKRCVTRLTNNGQCDTPARHPTRAPWPIPCCFAHVVASPPHLVEDRQARVENDGALWLIRSGVRRTALLYWARAGSLPNSRAVDLRTREGAPACAAVFLCYLLAPLVELLKLLASSVFLIHTFLTQGASKAQSSSCRANKAGLSDADQASPNPPPYPMRDGSSRLRLIRATLRVQTATRLHCRDLRRRTSHYARVYACIWSSRQHVSVLHRACRHT